MRVRALAIAASVACVASAPATADAIENTSPSKAAAVSVGVPFAATGENGKPDVWRLDSLVRPGDKVQFAVDNTHGSEDVDVCLFGPTDDYGYDDEVNASCDGLFDDRPGAFGVRSGRADRAVATYSRAAGMPFIRVSSLYDRVDNYTITVERIVRTINIGAVPPTQVGRNFSYTASLRYADNTPAADGTPVVLQWRGTKRTPGPGSFTTLASSPSTGGQAIFNAILPTIADRKIALRACVADESDADRCTTAATVRVAPSASASCLRAKAKVRSLRRRVRALRRHARKLTVTRRQLRAARRRAASRCS